MKNIVLTGLTACYLIVSFSTGAIARYGFEDDSAHLNFNIGSKRISDDYQLSNPPTNPLSGADVEVSSVSITAPAPIAAREKIGSNIYNSATTNENNDTTKNNILGNMIELDLESQTKFGIDFDYKVSVYNMPFNIVLGYFTTSVQSQSETFTQRLQGISADSPSNEKISTFTFASDVLSGFVESTTLTPEVELQSSEFRIGVRKYKDFNNGISIFYGLGVASMTYEVEGKYVKNGVQEIRPNGSANPIRSPEEATLLGFSETAATVGMYGEIATLYKLSRRLHVGAKVDFSSGEVDIEKPFATETESVQLGGMGYSLFAGLAF